MFPACGHAFYSCNNSVITVTCLYWHIIFRKLHHSFIEHELCKGYLIKCDGQCERTCCCGELFLIIHVRCCSFLKNSSRVLHSQLIAALLLLLLCHEFPPTEGSGSQHSRAFQFDKHKQVPKRDKYLPYEVLKHQWHLFSPLLLELMHVGLLVWFPITWSSVVWDCFHITQLVLLSDRMNNQRSLSSCFSISKPNCLLSC